MSPPHTCTFFLQTVRGKAADFSKSGSRLCPAGSSPKSSGCSGTAQLEKTRLLEWEVSGLLELAPCVLWAYVHLPYLLIVSKLNLFCPQSRPCVLEHCSHLKSGIWEAEAWVWHKSQPCSICWTPAWAAEWDPAHKYKTKQNKRRTTATHWLCVRGNTSSRLTSTALYPFPCSCASRVMLYCVSLQPFGKYWKSTGVLPKSSQYKTLKHCVRRFFLSCCRLAIEAEALTCDRRAYPRDVRAEITVSLKETRAAPFSHLSARATCRHIKGKASDLQEHLLGGRRGEGCGWCLLPGGLNSSLWQVWGVIDAAGKWGE